MASATTTLRQRPCITFLWRIENFSYFSSSFHSSGLLSPDFCLRDLHQEKLFLILSPEFKIVTQTIHTEICEYLTLKLNKKDSYSYRINIEWSFLDCKGIPLFSSTSMNVVLKCDMEFYMPNCPTMKEVCETRRSEFLPRDTLTMQLSIWKADSDFKISKFFFCRSRITVIEDSFLWPIQGISSRRLNNSAEYILPVKRTDYYDVRFTTLKWELIIQGSSLEEANVNCQVTACSIERPCPVILKISILHNERKLKGLLEHKHTFSKDAEICALSNVLIRKELLEKNVDCLPNDVLTLFCEVVYPEGKIHHCMEKSHYGSQGIEKFTKRSLSDPIFQPGKNDFPVAVSSSEDSVLALQDNFLAVYRDQTSSDFKLLSDGVPFFVHKVVLIARSPVFKAMFSSDMIESNSNCLDIPDLDSATLDLMLTFLYTGKVQADLPCEGASKLYYAADKYQVHSLKDMCRTNMMSLVSVNNVTEILTLATRHQDKELESFIHVFIANNFNEVMHSIEWENFMKNACALAGNTTYLVSKMKFKFSSKE